MSSKVQVTSNSSRRKFIHTAGLAVAGMSLFPYCSQSKESTLYGLQLYTLREQLSANLKNTLEAVAKIGYKELELFGYSEGKVFGLSPREFRKIVEDLGMRIVSGHYLKGGPNIPGPGTLTNGWEKAVEDAAEMGLEFMICAYLFPEERQSLDDYKRFAELLNTCGQVAQKGGIHFGYHNHDFEFQEMEGVLPMHLLMNGTEEDLVVAELDLYWASRAGYKPSEFFKKYPKRTALWHVKDMADSQEKEFTEVGNGVIDFKSIFAEQSISGMKYFFVEQDICMRPPLESIEISYRNLKNWGI